MVMRASLVIALVLIAVACAPGGGPIAVPPSTPGPTTGAAATAVPRDPVLADEVVQSGLQVPWDIAFAPDGRMFVTERPGRVVIFESGKPNAPRLGELTVPAGRPGRGAG